MHGSFLSVSMAISEIDELLISLTRRLKRVNSCHEQNSHALLKLSPGFRTAQEKWPTSFLGSKKDPKVTQEALASTINWEVKSG